MKNSYYYLIASLPMLHFGMKPLFFYPDFLEACSSELNQDDMGILVNLSIEPSMDIEDKLPLLKEWKSFNRGLGNELVRTRAAKKGKDPNKYLRGNEGLDPFIAPLAHWAVNQDSPAEAELYLDRARWEKIEEIKTGHYFDIEYLAAYGLQLKILERWHRINSGEGVKVLEGLAGKL
ncbi:MAG: DUF2764 family protein [Candidatus Omnitrophota bacterium]|nr:DUF2764 family protein [Candidatus Omnitrophota bacterium]